MQFNSNSKEQESSGDFKHPDPTTIPPTNVTPDPVVRVDWRSLVAKKGRKLPHWTCDLAMYHVSFRLFDSVPAQQLEDWRQERLAIFRYAEMQNRALSVREELRLQKLFSRKIGEFLLSGYGECFLKCPDVADLVVRSLRHFEGVRYHLWAWCVMPNHVHVVVEPLPDYCVLKIVQGWKSFTANQANRLLNRSGQFWQHESYDRIIRNQREFRMQIKYVWDNPDKAGLKSWKYRWKWDEDVDLV